MQLWVENGEQNATVTKRPSVNPDYKITQPRTIKSYIGGNANYYKNLDTSERALTNERYDSFIQNLEIPMLSDENRHSLGRSSDI